MCCPSDTISTHQTKKVTTEKSLLVALWRRVAKILLLRRSGFTMKYVTICRLTPMMLQLSGTLFHNIRIWMPWGDIVLVSLVISFGDLTFSLWRTLAVVAVWSQSWNAPDCRNDIVVPYEWRHTWHNRRFLQHQDTNNWGILVFFDRLAKPTSAPV